MNTRSLRFRLIAWYAGLLVGVFVLFGFAIYQVLSGYLERSLRESLVRRSDQIGNSLLPQINQSGEQYVIDEIKARFAPEVYDRFFRVTRPDGTVLYASGRAASFDPTGLAPLTKSVRKNFTRKEELEKGNKLLISTKIFRVANGKAFLVESGAPLQPIETMLGHLLSSLLLGLPIVVLVAVAGGYFLVGRALAPVVQIARSAEQITLHKLNERLPLPPTGDELEQLSVALNRMIARLRESFEQNQRFLADASHELRTPLTALRGELESVLELTRGFSELRERVGSSIEEVERLTKIVEALFAISRLDAGEAQAEWTHFDLAKLAVSTADQMSLLAEDKGVVISCHAQDDVNIEGDRARIKQIIVNLLDNAIKYTPAGGSVSLKVFTVENKAILEVVDTGIGIPAAARPRVFERFFRVDTARSRDIGGAGLGLAIVKSICSAHGGRVELESTEGRGSRFQVELPLTTVSKIKSQL